MKYFIVSCTLHSWQESIAYDAEYAVVPFGFSGPRHKIKPHDILVVHIINYGVIGAWIVVGDLNDMSRIWSGDADYSKRRVSGKPYPGAVLPWGCSLPLAIFPVTPSVRSSGSEIHCGVGAMMVQRLKYSVGGDQPK